MVGTATVQSPVSFGQPLTGRPALLAANKSKEAVPPITSSPGWPSMSAAAGPVRNWRSLTVSGQPARGCPVEASQAIAKSCPPWYSFTPMSSERISPVAGPSTLIPGAEPPRFAKAG